MINLIEPITQQSLNAAAKPNRSMGKDEFLKLLVAQLKSQNPLEPMNGTDFTAQLAQFSSLEQLFDINSSLSGMAAQKGNLDNLEAIGYVGKRIKATGNQMALAETGSAAARYALDSPAKVSIGVYDEAGKLVRTLDAGVVEAGEHDLVWDGLGSDGQRCAAGTYRFQVIATGLDGQQLPVTTYSLGTVSGVRLSSTGPRLIIGEGADGAEIALSDLTEIIN